MEMTETIGWKWCIWTGSVLNSTEYQFIRTSRGDWLVYCREERYFDEDDAEGLCSGGTRNVPVKRKDMDIVNV